jgi:hypothetical protein
MIGETPLAIRGASRCARLAQILDLFGEDSWRNVYAGELEVRPPGAPTIAVVSALSGPRLWLLAPRLHCDALTFYI